MGEKKVKPPKLPAGAPKELKDFIACKVMEVDLDPAKADWIPKPELVPDGLAPTVTPTANGANSVNVAVGWGFVALTLPVSVSGGQLQVDATNMPSKQAIDDWVKSFNDSLKSNGKDLAGLELKDGKIHLTKRAIAAPAQTTPTPETTPPPATTPLPVTPPTTDGATKEESTDGTKLKPGCLIGILVSVVLFLGVGIGFLVTRDDDSPSDSKATTSSHAPTTTDAPIDEALICARLEVVQQVLDDFGVDDPCEIDPDDFWDACYDYMPCGKLAIPLIVLNPTIGISHNGSGPDAATGETGPSEADHEVSVVGTLYDTTATVEVTSDCGGKTITGRSLLLPTGLTSIKHPLYKFGDCKSDLYYLAADFRQNLASYNFTVTDTPVAAGAAVTDGITVPTDNSLNAVGTTLGLLGGKALSPACTWYTANSAALKLDACLGDRWVFNAAYNDPRIASYGAGWINPLGVAAPTADQIAPFGASRLFGPGTLFPCGPGHLGYTACAKNQAAVETSSFVSGTVTWSTRLDEMPDGTYIKIGVEDYWLQLARDANTWDLTSSEGDDSQGRAILRGNSVTFMVPYDEAAAPDLAYTVTVGDDSGEVAQSPQPVLGLVTSTQGPETPSDFFQRLSESIATGDLTYAFDRLHPCF